MRTLIAAFLILVPSLALALHFHFPIKKNGLDKESGFTFKVDVTHNDNGTSDYIIQMSRKPPSKDTYYVPDSYFPHAPMIIKVEGWSPHPTAKIQIERTTTSLKSSFTIPTVDIPKFQWTYKDAGPRSMGGFVYDILLADFSKSPPIKKANKTD